MKTKTNKEIRVLTNPIEVRAEEGQPVSISGYAAVYSRQSEDMGFIEVIEPGAFTGADTTDVRALVNHDSSMILGRTSAGTLTVNTDEVGLRYQLELPNTSYARDLAESMKRGDITQSSFAFSEVEDTWEERGDQLHRSITKIKRLHDVSPVTYPAYTDTSVALRSMEEFKKAQESEAPEGKEETEELNLRLLLASKRYR